LASRIQGATRKRSDRPLPPGIGERHTRQKPPVRLAETPRQGVRASSQGHGPLAGIAIRGKRVARALDFLRRCY